ncbi:fast kinase domain-containing protein 5 [Lasius niger]|uniref:Fast kinase domain-containing protein 5 n=1 Tax=Lasius niger TaxID=67767 RepID=A0A0J7KTC5_LASNI|nr:fast kinase domain-containing protein 5 [Lasius niger]
MMSVLTQRLSRLRCTYSVLLRLCNKSNYGTLSKRGLSNYLKLSHVHHVTRNSRRCREFAILAADHQQVDADSQRVADDRDESPAKLEILRENDYAHNLFLNSFHYSTTVMKPITTHAYVTNEEALRFLEQDWSLMTSEEILFAIKKLSYNICLGKNERIDPLKYTNAFNAICIEKMTDDDLMIMMRHLVPFRNPLNYSFYHNFCDRVDRECTKRFSQLSINRMLLLCDVIYQMMQSNKSQYMWYSMRKLGNKPNKLQNARQLVQILFFLNVCRKPPINMYELEYCLERCINDLSINELGIAALGFFKTGTQIRNVNFLIAIMKKIIAEVEIVDSVSIGALLKLIRYSMKLNTIPMLQELVTALTPHEPRFTLMSLTHIAHACARVALYDKEFMDRMIRRFNSELKTARLKDFERFIFVLASLNVDSSNSVYQNMIEELRTTWDTSRANEISKYPQVASRILGYLAVLSIYPTDLIGRVMGQEHLEKVYRNWRYLTREYCVLDYSLRLEVPEYNGPFLKPSTCNLLEKDLFNTTDISVVRPLPHYAPPDIVFCLDEQNRLVPSKEFLSQFQESEIMRVDKETSRNVRWIALVMAPCGLLIRNTNFPAGMLAVKLRQLPLVGYTPIMISHISWFECTSPQERCDYLKKLVFKDNAELPNK